MAETTTFPPAAGGRRKRRRREITAGDIETLPIEAYMQEESTKGSYSSYIKPFIQFMAVVGHLYPEAMKRIHLTADYQGK